MKLATLVFALWAALAQGQAQQFPVCTADLVKTDECADVINPAACYNQFRWNTRTLTCIEGTNDQDRKRKACKCCTCVGTAMCTWLTNNRFCAGI
ncbi:hypothetical protein GGTG_13156 [Gaeumannomyces tritici R3-111a-1]|uniref:Uncharacterized protein n=1 Tax=Gaeumannomyces tritici (strain R3-111a-1) TaxID=644352 RepID=J3PI26_GAET3|nr:hypothetical protein GGTG_13156 [Gaeumannomyces tritici R3-111a-1]EJT69538.1 hypothetical protein GGTG_13156 [Gaeumannomyces tritici R3-111a-1]